MGKMNFSDKRFVPLVPLPTLEPNRLSPQWMYSGLARTETCEERPSITGLERAPEVNRSRSSSLDGSYEGVDFPLAARTPEAGRRRGKYGAALDAWWAWMKRHRKSLLLLAVMASLFFAVASFVASLTRNSSSPVAAPAPPPKPAPPPTPQLFKAVVTWNNYSAQVGTVCGPKAPANVTYFGAAASDISPDISGGKCAGSIDTSVCNRTTAIPLPSYLGPSCPRTNCGRCYRIYSLGPLASDSPIQSPATFPSPPSNSSLRSLPNVSVQIIDSCPASNAGNYCKMFGQNPVPADERCGDPGVNALDIDVRAWETLSGGVEVKGGGGRPGNLWVWGEKVDC